MLIQLTRKKLLLWLILSLICGAVIVSAASIWIFKRHIGSLKPHRYGHTHFLFKRMDKSDDELISRKEYQRFVQRTFERLDDNENARIEADEMPRVTRPI